MKTLLAVYVWFGVPITTTEIILTVIALLLLGFIVVQTFGFISRLSSITEDHLEDRSVLEKEIERLKHIVKEDENSKHELRKEIARLDKLVELQRIEINKLEYKLKPEPYKNEYGRWIDGKTGQYIKAPKDV